MVTRSKGEEAFAQTFQFKPSVPSEDHEELRDFLYKYAHNFGEAKEYLQILKQVDEIEYNIKSELLFRIQAMSLQCFPLAMRRLTDNISKRSLQKLVSKIIKDELKPAEIDKIKNIHEHYKPYLDKGVAHQDELSIKEILESFPDTKVIKADMKNLEDMYNKIVTEICSKYINIGGTPVNYAQQLKRLVLSVMDDEQEFVRKPFPADDVYDRWLGMLDKIEQSTISTSSEDRDAVERSLEIGYKLFPIIDSISFTLFDKNGRHYLKQLGYSDAEADVAYKSLRNGLLHNTSAKRLFYEDGEVQWSIFSSSGSGGFTPHHPGDDYFDADKGIEYFKIGEVYYIWITYDRLVSHIRHDLLQRKSQDTRITIDQIIGEKIKTSRRTAPKINS